MNKPRAIAFTDFEMSGIDPLRHEILEVGLIVADIETLEERSRFDVRVAPEHLETADPAALQFMGYDPELWRDAMPLAEMLSRFGELANGAIFAAWNTPFDWTFLAEAFRSKQTVNPLDYHTIDVFSIAYEKLRTVPELENFKLSKVCEHLGVPKEPMPHRAINGAECAYQLYKKLRALS